MDSHQMVHLRFPVSLLKDIDAIVKRTGSSRNEVVTDAVNRYLSGLRMAEKIRGAYGSLGEQDAPDWVGGGADWVRRIRDQEDGGRMDNELPD
jgi:hypothetical protein